MRFFVAGIVFWFALTAAGFASAGSYTWYDGDVPRSIERAPLELALIAKRQPGPADMPLEAVAQQLFHGAELISVRAGSVRVRLPQPPSSGDVRTARRAAQAFAPVLEVSPVFYDRAGGRRLDGGVYLLTGEMVVQFERPTTLEEAQAWGRDNGSELLRQATLPRAFVYRCSMDHSCLRTANAAYAHPSVRYAYPNWIRPRATRSVRPDDPLYFDQWHLENTGQSGGVDGEDINAVSAWQGYAGSGVTIAVIDDGVEIAHEDIAANVIPGASYDYLGQDDDPTPTRSEDGHGTACAGVAVARAGNAVGVSGAAPLASLVGYNPLLFATDENEADAFVRAAGVADVATNSWGPADGFAFLHGPGPLAEQALADSVVNGRNGRGMVLVWAGGNGGDGDDANLDGYANSRYTIAVGASDHLGRRAGYSERGANLLVTAPSSGGGGAITTVDLSGDGGYATGNYTSGFGGTSSAAPLVAGTVALMLEANPALGWRDVQAILARTAERIDASDADWVQNGAGYWVNHKYGFGRVDAGAAVAMAETWTPLPEEFTGSAVSGVQIPIPDADPTGVSDTLTLADEITIENVDIYFSADVPDGGDLRVVLTSPAGTQSVLAPSLDANNAVYDGWRFGVARLRGESAKGTWTLQVSDHKAGETGNLTGWRIEVHGTAPGPSTVGDADGDGMRDDWEALYGLDSQSPHDAYEDPDADGYANLYEHHGDSDPLDPANVPTDPTCSGESVYIFSRTYADGEWVLCEGRPDLTAGEAVRIESGAAVHYVAPRVVLQPGFSVAGGGRFHAGASLP